MQKMWWNPNGIREEVFVSIFQEQAPHQHTLPHKIPYIHTYIATQNHTHTHTTHICVCVCVCVCVYIYMYIYIYIYTHTHKNLHHAKALQKGMGHDFKSIHINTQTSLKWKCAYLQALQAQIAHDFKHVTSFGKKAGFLPPIKMPHV